MKKTEVKMNKPIYLGQAILDMRKTLMYEFWYDYIKPKYGDKVKLCYMDTDSFIMHIETKDFYKDIADDVDRWFDTSNYDKNNNRPLFIEINKKIIGICKDELGGKILTEFCALRAKAHAYLTENGIEHKKDKGTKKCRVKRELMFKHYKDCLFDDIILLKSQHRFRSDHHKVYAEEVNKKVLSSNDDKRIQAYDKITTYPYGTNTFMVCENEMRYVLQRKNMLNTESQEIRNELQVCRNESQILSDEFQKLRNEAEALRNEAQALRNKSRELRNE